MAIKRGWMVLTIGVGLLTTLQAVPYGRSHDNPPVTGEPAWPSAQVRDLVARACLDCHGNQTNWPWYASVAPVSWLVQYDVDEGREKLNFSQWDRPQREADEAAKEVQEGEMPPWPYTLLHPDARLTSAEKEVLVNALRAIGAPPGSEAGENAEGDRGDD